MTHVVIDGVEYIPKAEIPPLADDKLTHALKELVSLYYFGDWHKARGRIYNAIEYLAPELAALVDDYPKAAYDRLANQKIDRGESDVGSDGNTMA